MATKTLAHQLAEYACSLRFEDLSRNVIHEVKRRIIDSLGCALGAWKEEPCAIAQSAPAMDARQIRRRIETRSRAYFRVIPSEVEESRDGIRR